MISVSRTIAIAAMVLSLANVTSAAPGTEGPDFFWLPPTVPTAPVPTAPFDFNAQNQLVIEICQLVDGACSGPLVERFSGTESSFFDRIRVHPLFQFYAAEWLTALSAECRRTGSTASTCSETASSSARSTSRW